MSWRSTTRSLMQSGNEARCCSPDPISSSECRPKMASTWCASVLLGRIESSCPGPHLSPYENKVGGYPVRLNPL